MFDRYEIHQQAPCRDGVHEYYEAARGEMLYCRKCGNVVRFETAQSVLPMGYKSQCHGLVNEHIVDSE